jgi:hypothetical protein
MNQKQKKLISYPIIAVLVVGGYYLLFGKKQTEQKKELNRETISQGDLIAKELADKYQAITDWEKNLTYTIQAQNRLVSEKPVLFRGYVDDVFSRNGKTFFCFSSSILSPIDYILELECSKQVLDKILSREQNEENELDTDRSSENHNSNDVLQSHLRRMLSHLFADCVVIARIEEVSKPVFALKGSVLSREEVEIGIESSMLFTAKGACVDIVYIDRK